jgi:hypothetical protein
LLYPECKMDYRPCVLFRYNEYRDKWKADTKSRL